MFAILHALGMFVADQFKSRSRLEAENLFLRHQLAIALRRAPPRFRLRGSDRALRIWMTQLWPSLIDAAQVVQPETILRWHRAGFKVFWRWKSRNRAGRPKIDRSLRDLIRRMSRENALGGASRIHGELLVLGFEVAQSTVSKYMVRCQDPPSQTWKTFLKNHADAIAAIDMCIVPTLTFDLLFAFLVLGHGRRQLLWFEVTRHPTAEWLARQITEAFPWASAPAYLVRDNDRAYGDIFTSRVRAMGPFAGIDEIVNIAKQAEALGYHSVWGNDHMTTQRYVKAEFSAVPRYWEPLVTYAYLAAETTRLKFGTGLLVLPMRRDIVVTAKQIATVDHLSRGRLEIGIGVGAYREEFEALQPSVKVHRGNMVEEGVQALRKLFEERSASFDGEYYKFSMVELSPKPYQKRFPLYLGGNNINAVERAARYGDGWIPAGIPIEQLRKGVARLRELVAVGKRTMSEMQIAPQYICRIAPTRERAIAEFRNSQIAKHLESLRVSTLKEQGNITFEDINLIGSPDDIRAKVQIAREAGVTHMLGTLFAADSVPDLLDQMRMFAEEIAANSN